MSSLVPLLEIITTGVADLKSAEKKNNTLVPDLSAPFHPASEAFRADPVAAESAAKIVAAATQLVATLSPPVEGLYALAAAGVSSPIRTRGLFASVKLISLSGL